MSGGCFKVLTGLVLALVFMGAMIGLITGAWLVEDQPVTSLTNMIIIVVIMLLLGVFVVLLLGGNVFGDSYRGGGGGGAQPGPRKPDPYAGVSMHLPDPSPSRTGNYMPGRTRAGRVSAPQPDDQPIHVPNWPGVPSRREK